HLRQTLPEQFPHMTFFFQSADIVGQILNFGLAAPIDIQVMGRNRLKDYEIAKQIEARVARLRGSVDVHVHQIVDAPELFVEVDRSRASERGLARRDVGTNMLVALRSSGWAAAN